MTDPSGKVERPWRREVVTRFYTSHRTGLEGLYDSEKEVLPRALEDCDTVLDVGCAAGGLFEAMRAFRTGLRYTGIDLAEDLLRAGRVRCPEARFALGRAARLPVRVEAADLAYCVSLLHVLPDYPAAIREIYRAARRRAVFDARIVPGETISDIRRSWIDVTFGEEDSSAETRIPYILVRAEEFLEILLSLRPAPRRITAVGRTRPPSEMARCPFAEVGMIFFSVEKGGGGETEVVWDAPYAPPGALASLPAQHPPEGA